MPESLSDDIHNEGENKLVFMENVIIDTQTVPLLIISLQQCLGGNEKNILRKKKDVFRIAAELPAKDPNYLLHDALTFLKNNLCCN